MRPLLASARPARRGGDPDRPRGGVALQLRGPRGPGVAAAASVVPSAAVGVRRAGRLGGAHRDADRPPSLAAPTASPTATPVAALSLITVETVRDGTLDVLATSPDGASRCAPRPRRTSCTPRCRPTGPGFAYGVEDLVTWTSTSPSSPRARPAPTSGARLQLRPAWSPDGLRLAFVSSRDGTTDRIPLNRRRLPPAAPPRGADSAEGPPNLGRRRDDDRHRRVGDERRRDPQAERGLCGPRGGVVSPSRLTEEDGSGSPAGISRRAPHRLRQAHVTTRTGRSSSWAPTGRT